MNRPTDIYIGNLALEATETDILQLFEACGRVLEVKITRDKITSLSKACVTMQDLTEACKAVEILANRLIYNKAMVLILDKNREFFHKYA